MSLYVLLQCIVCYHSLKISLQSHELCFPIQPTLFYLFSAIFFFFIFPLMISLIRIHITKYSFFIYAFMLHIYILRSANLLLRTDSTFALFPRTIFIPSLRIYVFETTMHTQLTAVV